jgi:hypothetical protein
MTTKMKRLVVLLPPDEYERLMKLADERYESASAIGRRLLVEWMDRQEEESNRRRIDQKRE